MSEFVSEQNTPTQDFEAVLDKVHFIHQLFGKCVTIEEAIKIFNDVVSEWLQSKPFTLNYLTEKETKMSGEEVNLQIVLGLQSCKTKSDVCRLLDDIRTHERIKLLEELE